MAWTKDCRRSSRTSSASQPLPFDTLVVEDATTPVAAPGHTMRAPNSPQLDCPVEVGRALSLYVCVIVANMDQLSVTKGNKPLNQKNKEITKDYVFRHMFVWKILTYGMWNFK